MNEGKFIVVEGIEGAGKSTAMTVIDDILNTYSLPHIMTREPGGTRIGEHIRSILKDTSIEHETLDVRTELLLLYASRMQLMSQVIQPALEKGTWVVSDRFELSTFAYQGGGRAIPEELIKSISSFCMQGFQADLILYLDIDPERGFERIIERGELDRIEREPLSFFKSVVATYRNLVQSMPQAVFIDANQELIEVKKAIQSALAHFFNQNNTNILK